MDKVFSTRSHSCAYASASLPCVFVLIFFFQVAFLNKIKHPHIVEYKACFLKEQTCWVCFPSHCLQAASLLLALRCIRCSFQLVMEYCIGSAADIVDVLRQGIREIEISAICSETLSALHYLHQLKRIHRDIKAGNILLSDTAHVKLGSSVEWF